MEYSQQTLLEQMILTAAMPFDDKNAIEKLVKTYPACNGLAVLPSYINTVKKMFTNDHNSELIGLVGYPTGGATTKTKVNEIRDMIYDGANSFHVVVNTGYVLSGNWDDLQWEMMSIAHAAGVHPVSMIMEAAYLSDPQIMRLVNICVETGIKNIGTSTGWLPLNPDLDQITRIVEMVYNRLGVMVAGLVNLDQVTDFLNVGVDKIVIRQQHAEAILAQLS